MLWWWKREWSTLKAQVALALEKPRAELSAARADYAAYKAAKGGDCDTLEDWLVIATWKLSDDAKQRIREEVDSHFAESVAELMNDGFSERYARESALDQLGSPHQARRSYRSENLARWEAGSVNQFKREFDAQFDPGRNWSLTLFGQRLRGGHLFRRLLVVQIVLLVLFVGVLGYPSGAFRDSPTDYIEYGKTLCLFLFVFSFIGMDSISRIAMRSFSMQQTYILNRIVLMIGLAFAGAAFVLSAYGYNAYGSEAFLWGPLDTLLACYFAIAIPFSILGEYRIWRKAAPELREHS